MRPLTCATWACASRWVVAEMAQQLHAWIKPRTSWRATWIAADRARHAALERRATATLTVSLLCALRVSALLLRALTASRMGLSAISTAATACAQDARSARPASPALVARRVCAATTDSVRKQRAPTVCGMVMSPTSTVARLPAGVDCARLEPFAEQTPPCARAASAWMASVTHRPVWTGCTMDARRPRTVAKWLARSGAQQTQTATRTRIACPRCADWACALLRHAATLCRTAMKPRRIAVARAVSVVPAVRVLRERIAAPVFVWVACACRRPAKMGCSTATKSRSTVVGQTVTVAPWRQHAPTTLIALAAFVSRRPALPPALAQPRRAPML